MRPGALPYLVAMGLSFSCAFACGGADNRLGDGPGSPDAGDVSADGSTPRNTGGAGSGGETGDGGDGMSSGGAPDGGGSGGTPAISCDNSLDCVDVPGGPFVCNPATSRCVECLSTADCEENHDCVANECVVYVPCVNSLDCPMGLVCDSVAERCVECVRDGDCGSDETCAGGACALVCESDRACTPLGLLCDATAGHCAECIRHVDCGAPEYCDAGVCRNDVCDAGTSRCVNNAVVACSAEGDLSGAPAPCLAAETCVEASGAAACEPWVCTPDATECTSSTVLTTCSADGLSVVDTTDCGMMDQLCANGACSDTVCPPSELYCQEGEVRQCSGDGSAFTVADVCLANEYCDSAGPACMPYACLPTAMYCVSNEVRQCAANGQDYTVADTCTAGEYCDAAAPACATDVCAQGESYCASNEVRQCNADGSDYTISDTCTASEYCDTAAPSCKALVCTANEPACNGNTATTCNATGSGYLAGGTPCGSQFCVRGECSAQVLFEDFEDGDSVGWVEVVAAGTAASTDTILTAGAATTAHRLNIDSDPGVLFLGGTGGFEASFSPVSATFAGFWIRKPTTTRTSRFNLLSVSPIVVYVGLSSTGTFIGSGIATAGVGSYSANTWYHVEIRNLNLAAGNYDLYVNNALVSAGTFTPPASGTVNKVLLTNTVPSGVTSVQSDWDEIDIH